MLKRILDLIFKQPTKKLSRLKQFEFFDLILKDRKKSFFEWVRNTFWKKVSPCKESKSWSKLKNPIISDNSRI